MRRFLGYPFLLIALSTFWLYCKVAGVSGFIGEVRDNAEEE